MNPIRPSTCQPDKQAKWPSILVETSRLAAAAVCFSPVWPHKSQLAGGSEIQQNGSSFPIAETLTMSREDLVPDRVAVR